MLRAAQDLNYHPNAAAQSLKLRASRTLGMLVPDITNPVFPAIFKGVEETARDAGYDVILANTDGSTDKSPYRGLLVGRRVDGLILATAMTDDETIRDLVDKRFPFVLVNRRAPELNDRYVVPDDLAGAREAVEHLIRLGHRRIAHISGPLYTETGLNRLKAYREALRDHRLAFEGGWVVESDFREVTGYRAMRRLLEHPDRMTAVFCANDLAAVGAIKAARERGLRVPDDISLVGFNNLPWTEHLNPSLTTVEVPLYDMGVLAARMLLSLVSGEEPAARSHVVPVRLIERGSTGPPPPS